LLDTEEFENYPKVVAHRRREYHTEDDWFTALFGFQELSKAVYRNIEVTLDGRNSYMKSFVNGRTYKIGKFSTPSVAELRKHRRGDGILKLSIWDNRDISELQQDPSNRHAVFQVASQFNCLEFIDPSDVPEMGVTRYANDKTQGPACSISCGPATVYRNYFATTNNKIGQTANNQINNLDDIERLINNRSNKFFYVKNGYALSDKKSISKLSNFMKTDRELRKQISLALKVGLHEDVQVTSSNWGKFQLVDPSQLITQVFCSACAIAYSKAPAKSWEMFARAILLGAYQACFEIAIDTAERYHYKDASNVLYLTLLGGGVFGNGIDWIGEAIIKMCKKYANFNLDVRIVTYKGPPREIQTYVNMFNNNSIQRR
jgi:hypothetical protein